jgi:hypothetical protein
MMQLMALVIGMILGIIIDSFSSIIIRIMPIDRF